MRGLRTKTRQAKPMAGTLDQNTKKIVNEEEIINPKAEHVLEAAEDYSQRRQRGPKTKRGGLNSVIPSRKAPYILTFQACGSVAGVP